jgi:hypothetical protein
VIERWIAFVHGREPVVGLALFRIAIGSTLAWTLVRTIVTGAGSALFVPPEAGGMVPLEADWRFDLLGGPSAGAVAAVTAVALVGSALVTIGLGARPAALVTGQCCLALMSLVPESGGGHDRLYTNALWLLVLAPCDASWSVACRLRTGSWIDPTPRASIARWLAMLQLVMTYTVTGWQKLGAEWWPWGGLTAVYRSLLQPDWERTPLPWLGSAFPLTQLATVATIVFEGGFPVVPLWMWARHRHPRLRRYDARLVFFAMGVGMHAILEATLNLGPFAWVTMAFYLCFFDAAEYAAAARWLTDRTRAVSVRFPSPMRRTTR